MWRYCMCMPVKKAPIVGSCFCFPWFKNKVNPVEVRVQVTAQAIMEKNRSRSDCSLDSAPTNRAVMVKMVAWVDRERSTSLKYFV